MLRVRFLSTIVLRVCAHVELIGTVLSPIIVILPFVEPFGISKKGMIYVNILSAVLFRCGSRRSQMIQFVVLLLIGFLCLDKTLATKIASALIFPVFLYIFAG